jgi:hypothetical protein
MVRKFILVFTGGLPEICRYLIDLTSSAPINKHCVFTIFAFLIKRPRPGWMGLSCVFTRLKRSAATLGTSL